MRPKTKSTKIESIIAREILDSRGNPTIETKIMLNNGNISKASVPSGASTGVHESLELRDKDPKRFHGKGVTKAVNNVNGVISKKFKNSDICSLQDLDTLMLEMDGTENKSNLGANAILSVSMAYTRTLARLDEIPLYEYLRKYHFKNISGWTMPRCMMNVVNGGAHSNWSTDIQEYMIVPNSKSASEQVRIGSEIFHSLESILKKNGLSVTVGDEGGFAPKADSNSKPLIWIMGAIKESGHSQNNVSLALDVAASGFYKDGAYNMKVENKNNSTDEMISLYKKLIKKFPITSIEDGLAEDDWEGWKKLTKEIGSETHLIGDDLFVTNIKRIQKGINEKSANGVLIKLNQIGSVTETIKAIALAQANKYVVAVSHRSGETTDDFISDLSTACGANFLKAGSISRGERIAKYNRLMEIESELQRL